jgi:hypothetical protein
MPNRREFIALTTAALAVHAHRTDVGLAGIDHSKALFVNAASIQAGLQYRSLADTATGTLEWWQAQPAERRANPRRWPAAETEQAAIAKIKAG